MVPSASLLGYFCSFCSYREIQSQEMLFCPLKPAPAHVSYWAHLGIDLGPQPLLSSSLLFQRLPWGALAMWAVLGTDLFQSFILAKA